VKPTLEPAPVKPTPEPVPEPPRRALRAPEDEPGKDAPRVFGSESGPGLGSFVLHPKVGLLVTGSGNSDTQYECSGIFRATCPPGDSFTEGTKPGLGLGIDALLHLSPHLRVGLGFLYLTNTKSDENGRTIAWGTDLSLPLLVEGVFDVFAAVRVGVRAEGGPALLFPGGDLQDWLDRREAICADAGVHDVLCHADSGSFFGGVLGGGGFVSYGVGPVRFRADVVLQYFTLDAGGAQIGDGGNEWDMSTSYSGLRLWLLGGVEL
jgi:hypothetical protein